MHIPVLQKEALQYLDPKPNENFIDCTLGEAGHTLAILEKNAPKGKVLGIDQDTENIKKLEARFKNHEAGKRIILTCDNFANLKEIVSREKISSVSGILFDLGMSSWHLDESGRGFSFKRNEPLDMRYSMQNPLTAEKIINYWSEAEIEKTLEEFGEERFSRQIAKSIIETRKIKFIKSTFQLVEIIKNTVPHRYLKGKIHFATRAFQALRIAVNDELNNLEKGLLQSLEILKVDGKLTVISFHSLEDRIVKNFFRNLASQGVARPLDGRQAKEGLSKIKILTKKPITPSREEVKNNPRSRSAKLRAAQKI